MRFAYGDENPVDALIRERFTVKTSSVIRGGTITIWEHPEGGYRITFHEADGVTAFRPYDHAGLRAEIRVRDEEVSE
jgi:hypothetical protein